MNYEHELQVLFGSQFIRWRDSYAKVTNPRGKHCTIAITGSAQTFYFEVEKNTYLYISRVKPSCLNST